MEKKQNLAIRQKSDSAEQEKIFQNKLIKNRKSKGGSHPEVFSGERCSENIQQIYRRTPMSKCDFNKVAKQLYLNHTSAWMFSCKFAADFQNTFS